METGRSKSEQIPVGIDSSTIEPELRISVKWVIAILGVVGLMLILVGDAQSDPSYRMRVLYFAALFYAVAAVAWALDDYRPWASQWFVVIALITMLCLGNLWLEIPGFLTLVVVPTALTAALFSIPIATAIAIGETALLLLMRNYVAPNDTPATVIIAVVAIWATLAVVYAVYRPVRELNAWLWEYSQRTQRLLKEARDRKLELTQAFDDLVHLNQQLTLASERMASLRSIAEEALKTKAAFVARVSHEFRTPLNMIIGLIDLLVETPEVYGQELPPALMEDLDIVLRNCEHLSSLVNDVLDLSRAEAGRMAMYKEQVDLVEIIHSAVTAIQPVLEKKHLGLEMMIPEEMPTVYCDRTRIRQVIINLVSNAAHFTKEGGVKIQVAEREHEVVLSVTDTGPGISSQDAGKIFEPFRQGEDRLWHDKSGSGLGLSISRQFVKLHGGRIWLESELGRGSTFSFSLPISPPITHVVRPGHWVSKGWGRAKRTARMNLPIQPGKPRIVVCDETDHLYSMLAHYADEAELANVRDLGQAIEEAHQVPVHAILLNAASPDSLWPMMEKARQEMPDTPILGCSVPAPQEHMLDANSAANYLVKPVTRAHLHKVLQEAGRPVKTVLVVSNEPDVSQLLSRLLHACDPTLKTVTRSSEGLSLDDLLAHLPDLVLLDTPTPDIDNQQILELKNKDEALRDIPVIPVSTQDFSSLWPTTSPLFVATLGEGLPLRKLLCCSLEIPALLFKPA